MSSILSEIVPLHFSTKSYKSQGGRLGREKPHGLASCKAVRRIEGLTIVNSEKLLVRLCEIPQLDVHADFKRPVPGEAVIVQRDAAPSQLRIGLPGGIGGDEIAVFQIFNDGSRLGRHAGFQPGQDCLPVDVGLPEVVGVAGQIVAHKGQNVLTDNIFIAKILQDTVCQSFGEGAFRGGGGGAGALDAITKGTPGNGGLGGGGRGGDPISNGSNGSANTGGGGGGGGAGFTARNKGGIGGTGGSGFVMINIE